MWYNIYSSELFHLVYHVFWRCTDINEFLQALVRHFIILLISNIV